MLDSGSKLIGGSSPLARGTRGWGVEDIHRVRFIPTRAGNTQHGAGFLLALLVHPHSRGEHLCSRNRTARTTGSSPLARGTLVILKNGIGQCRFIPTRAGNTLAVEQGVPDLAGSSPLARGTRQLYGQAANTQRFIPTRAGNTLAGRTRPRRIPVHPHSRGEHCTTRVATSNSCGSSPLARGTHRPSGNGAQFHPVHPHSRGEHGRRESCRVRLRRFIPTRAGNTLGSIQSFAQGVGSSPLARGTPMQRGQFITSSRFIPTRAGNTFDQETQSGCAPVHPHSRGEHPGPNDDGKKDFGSSPLARGTLVTGKMEQQGKTVHPHSRGEHAFVVVIGVPYIGSSPLARGTRGLKTASK